MFQGTTIIAVKKGERVAIAGDGQVTFGNNTIIKHSARRCAAFTRTRSSPSRSWPMH